MISQFLEQIRMEHIGLTCSLDSELQIESICSFRIRSRNRDILEILTVESLTNRALLESRKAVP